MINGRRLVSFLLDDGRLATFVGEKDSQPRPETYYLYLSRLRIVSRGTDMVATVAGQCLINMTRDGRFWTRIECNASDENDASYRFVFRSNGTPVNVQHSRPVTTRHPIETVDPKVVADIISRFRGAMARNGIQGVVTDLEACFEDSIGNVPAIRACMLYDMAAMRLDKDMRKLFESRSVDLEAPPFLTDRAFKARIEIYSGMAFDGSEAMALKYFGTAPSVVIGGLTN